MNSVLARARTLWIDANYRDEWIETWRATSRADQTEEFDFSRRGPQVQLGFGFWEGHGFSRAVRARPNAGFSP